MQPEVLSARRLEGEVSATLRHLAFVVAVSAAAFLAIVGARAGGVRQISVFEWIEVGPNFAVVLAIALTAAHGFLGMRTVRLLVALMEVEARGIPSPLADRLPEHGFIYVGMRRRVAVGSQLLLVKSDSSAVAMLIVGALMAVAATPWGLQDGALVLTASPVGSALLFGLTLVIVGVNWKAVAFWMSRVAELSLPPEERNLTAWDEDFFDSDSGPSTSQTIYFSGGLVVVIGLLSGLVLAVVAARGVAAGLFIGLVPFVMPIQAGFVSNVRNRRRSQLRRSAGHSVVQRPVTLSPSLGPMAAIRSRPALELLAYFILQGAATAAAYVLTRNLAVVAYTALLFGPTCIVLIRRTNSARVKRRGHW